MNNGRIVINKNILKFLSLYYNMNIYYVQTSEKGSLFKDKIPYIKI
jgi:hypothetical protein